MTSEILQGAHDCVLNNPQFNAINLTINSPVHKTKGVVDHADLWSLLLM